jgi:predicted nucleic acid-binding protein
VKFWDTSALIPLVARESTSETVRALAAADPEIAISFMTPVEIDSALWRKSRQERDESARQRALQWLAAIEDDWLVVARYEAAIGEARRIVRRRGLRGADAVQLACAVILRRFVTVSAFVTLDHALAAAARAEGFAVVP